MEHCPRTMTCSRQNANILRKSCPGIDHATLNSPFIAEVHGTNILNQLTATPCQLMIRGSLVGDSHILGESRGCRNDINPGNKCDCPHPHGTRKIRQPQSLGDTFWPFAFLVPQHLLVPFGILADRSSIHSTNQNFETTSSTQDTATTKPNALTDVSA